MKWSPKPLNFAPGIWRALLRDLWRRGEERREVGAFLLVAASGGSSVVHRWITYDELDASTLHRRYIRLEPTAFGQLSSMCTQLDAKVVADIHTHPNAPVQSESDRRYPMLAVPGHVALIAPRFAHGDVKPSHVSFNVYLGAGEWRSFFGTDAAALIVAP